MGLEQPRSQGFSLLNWVGADPIQKGKALGTRLGLEKNSSFSVKGKENPLFFAGAIRCQYFYLTFLGGKC